MSLTDSQLRFISEYMVDFRGPAAARRCGQTEVSCRGYAWRMLTNDNVCTEIARRQAVIRKKFQLSHERILRELSRIAFFDPAKIFDADGNLAPVKQWRIGERAVLKSVKFKKSGIELTFHDKLEALSMLAKHAGLLKERASLEELFALLPRELGNALRDGIGQQLAAERAGGTGPDVGSGGAGGEVQPVPQ